MLGWEQPKKLARALLTQILHRRLVAQQGIQIPAPDGFGAHQAKDGAVLRHKGGLAGLAGGEAQAPRLRRQGLFVLRGVQIEIVCKDVALDHGVDQHGDVHVLVHIFAQARRAHGLIEGGQAEDQPLAAQRLFHAGQILLFPQKDDVVVFPRAARGVGAVGRGVEHHVRARDQVQLPPGEPGLERRKLLRVGDVDRQLVGEEVDVFLVGGAHRGDAPPGQARDGLLAPRELVDGKIHRKALGGQLAHDALVPGGKRVERAGEEGHGPVLGPRKRQLVHPHADEKTVELVERRGLQEAGFPPLARLKQQIEQLFARPTGPAQPPLDGRGACDDLRAQHLQGSGVDVVVIVRHARQQQPHAAPDALAGVGKVHKRGAERAQRAGCGAQGAGADQIFQKVQALGELLVRQKGQKPAKIGRDVDRDLVLPGFELTQEIHDDLIALFQPQQGEQAHQRLAGLLAHGQMLAHRKQICKVHRRVEGLLAPASCLVQQCLDLGDLHDPVDRGLEVAQMHGGKVRLCLLRRAAKGQKKSVFQIQHRVAARRKGCKRRQKRVRIGKAGGQKLQPPKGQDPIRLIGGEHRPKHPYNVRKLLRLQPVQGQKVERVCKRKARRALRLVKPLQKRRQIVRKLQLVAGGKQAFCNDFQGV